MKGGPSPQSLAKTLRSYIFGLSTTPSTESTETGNSTWSQPKPSSSSKKAWNPIQDDYSHTSCTADMELGQHAYRKQQEGQVYVETSFANSVEQR